MGSRRAKRVAGGLIALMVLAVGCSSDDGSTSSDSTADVASASTSTTSPFPGSPELSADVVAGLKGVHASYIQRPAQVGLPPEVIAGDASPLMEAVDPERLGADLETVAVERAPADLDGHGDVTAYVESVFAEVVGDDGGVPDDLAGPTLFVEGTACSDRIVIVSARTRAPEGSPGANRNASGVAALLEAARVLSEDPLAASVLFVALDAEGGGPEAVVADLEDQGGETVAWIDLDGVGVTSPEEDPFLAVEHAYLLMATDVEDDYLARVAGLSTAQFLPGFWAWGAVFPEERRDDLGVRESAAADQDVPNLVFSDGGKWRDERVGTETDTTEIIDIDFLANSTRSLLAALVGLTTTDAAGDGTPDVCAAD